MHLLPSVNQPFVDIDSISSFKILVLNIHFRINSKNTAKIIFPFSTTQCQWSRQARLNDYDNFAFEVYSYIPTMAVSKWRHNDCLLSVCGAVMKLWHGMTLWPPKHRKIILTYFEVTESIWWKSSYLLEHLIPTLFV